MEVNLEHVIESIHMAKKVTIREVAERAKVGIGTVSRVLNRSEQVSEATRQRVQKAIDELGFKPNAIARQLPRRIRPRNLGVITRPFLEYHSFAERLRGVQLALQNHDTQYELMLFSTRSMQDYDERLHAIIDTGVVDGLLIIDLGLTDSQQEALENSGIPFVGLNHFRNQNWLCLGGDNEYGAYLATKHLIHLGHQRIAYVGDIMGDDSDFPTGQQRYNGYLRALLAAGLEYDDNLVQTGEHDFESACMMTRTLLKQPHPPTAIFAMSDTQALACIAEIKAAGLQVPDDISVIGYDDLDMSHHTGLTTVRQHLDKSGRLVTEYLLALIHDEEPDIPKLPQVEVVARTTTASPRM